MKYIAQIFMGNTWIDLTKPTSKSAATRKINEGKKKSPKSIIRIVKQK